MSFHKRPRFKSFPGIEEAPKQSKNRNQFCWVHKQTNCLITTKPKDKENYLWFQSLKEGSRFVELRLLERQGEIQDLNRQVPFVLNVSGKEIGKIVVDFMYKDCSSGEYVFEDVKPWDKKTRKYRIEPLWAWKRKHFEAQYEKKIKIV